MEFNVSYDHSSLRKVRTVFSLNEVNGYASAGHGVLFERMEANPDLYSQMCIFRNKETGKFVQAESRRFMRQYGEWYEYPEDHWDEILSVKEYARPRTLLHDWAAYVLPSDPQIGEEFYVEDLIEDVLVTEFWSNKIFAVDGIARWDGAGLEFKRELFDSSQCVIVG